MTNDSPFTTLEEEIEIFTSTEAFKELVKIAETLSKQIYALSMSIIECYPDKRLVYLALYHKSKRVRKKNRRRIMRYYVKALKGGKHEQRRFKKSAFNA